MSDGVALYYPHVEFRTPGWIKWSLLFWDRGVRRIVPEGISPNDSDEVREALTAGALINTDSTPFLELAAREFTLHLDAYKQIAEHVSSSTSEQAPYPIANDYVDASWDI